MHRVHTVGDDAGHPRGPEHQRRQQRDKKTRSEVETVMPVQQVEKHNERTRRQEITIERTRAPRQEQRNDREYQRRKRRLEQVALQTPLVERGEGQATQRRVRLSPRSGVKAESMRGAPQHLIAKQQRVSCGLRVDVHHRGERKGDPAASDEGLHPAPGRAPGTRNQPHGCRKGERKGVERANGRCHAETGPSSSENATAVPRSSRIDADNRHRKLAAESVAIRVVSALMRGKAVAPSNSMSLMSETTATMIHNSAVT